MTREDAKHIVDVAFDVPQAVRRAGEDRTYHEDEIREAKKMAIEALSQEPCEDAISRDDALMCMTGEYIADKEYKPEDIISKHIRRLRALPPVQPKYNVEEWCKTCSEYNHEKHCCPRYNKVIRKAVEEIMTG